MNAASSGGTVRVQEGGQGAWGGLQCLQCSENTDALNSTGNGNKEDNMQLNDKAEKCQMTQVFLK